MANKKRILKSFVASTDFGLAINKSVAYRADFEAIVSGICLEGTPYKDTVYLRRYVQPFFSTEPRVMLTYSPRVRLENKSAYFEGSDIEIAAQCLSALDELGIVETLRRPMSARSFIEWLGAGNQLGGRATAELDLGAAYLMERELETAASFFEAAKLELRTNVEQYGARPFTDRLAEDIARYTRLLSTDAVALRQLVIDDARSNAAALGFIYVV